MPETTAPMTPTVPVFEDRVEELWTHLHRADVEDLIDGVGRIDRLARAMATAGYWGYVDNTEIACTPEESLADARMVARLADLARDELDRVASDLGVIRSKVAELIQLAETAQYSNAAAGEQATRGTGENEELRRALRMIAATAKAGSEIGSTRGAPAGGQ